jgi:hypothetical protein
VTRYAGDYTHVLGGAEFDRMDGAYRCLQAASAYFDDGLSRHCEELEDLCSYTHPLAGSFSNLKALKLELKKRHKVEFCHICLQGRKVFVSEQLVYTKQQLQRHMKQGDDEGPMARSVGFKGHPLCQYCDKRFYGENEQFEHMTRVHEECFICKRQNPHKHVYYEDYASLEHHFRDEHHMCEHESCLEQKFIVFSTEQQLKTHIVREHGGNMSKAEKKQALAIETGFMTGDRANARGASGSDRNRNIFSNQNAVIIGGDANMPSRSRNASSSSLPVDQEERGSRAQSRSQQPRNQSHSPCTAHMANLNLDADFPTMASTRSVPVGGQWAGSRAPHQHRRQLSGNNSEDFPALGADTRVSETNSKSSRPPGPPRPGNMSTSRTTSKLASVVGTQRQTRVIHSNLDAFPSLEKAPSSSQGLKAAPMSSSLRRASEALLQKARKRLGNGKVYSDFKQSSESWAEGGMATDKYHELIVSLGIANLVPEIAATCTNAKAREELLDAHAGYDFSEKASPGSAKRWVPPEVAALSKAALSRGGGAWSCAVCTLLNSELNKTCEACGSMRTNNYSRTSSAEDVTFPSLSTGGGDGTSNAHTSSASAKGRGKKMGLKDFYTDTRVHPQNVWKNPNLR